MINYCMGNVGAMRRCFRSINGENVVSIDNDDVIADFLIDGKVYFVLGDIPCANMSVLEYLPFARALKSKLPLSRSESKRLLKSVGARVSLNAKLGKLSRITYRKLQFASKVDTAIKCVYVNFSGIQYSLFAKRAITKLLNSWGKKWQVVAGFSDHRFVPQSANATVFLANGTVSGRVRQTSSHIASSAFKKVLSTASLSFNWSGKIQIITSDN